MEPTDSFSIRLQAQQWNQIVTILHDVAYRVAAPLIAEIGAQARAAEQAPAMPAPAPAAEVPAKANGADPHPDTQAC
jgi:hypothetical protein